jgi:predicted alpha-1,2-mannosidase
VSDRLSVSRYVLVGAALAVLTTLLPATAEAAGGSGHPSRYVDPFIGTAPGPGANTGGNTFPGPVVPNGMIRLGPDTVPGTANPGGGYSYADTQIRGFSVKRMSGAGCANYGDIPITPTTAAITTSPMDSPASRSVSSQYFSTFSHDEEHAGPGSYDIDLHQASGDVIDTKLTTSVRAAAARLTFGPHEEGSFLIDVAGGRSAKAPTDASVSIDPNGRTVTGSTTTGGFCFPSNELYKMYFVIQFNQPMAGFGTWQAQALTPGSTSAHVTDPAPTNPAVGAQAGAYVTFHDPRKIEMRVGISFVSIDGARANLQAEVGRRTFESIEERATQAWDEVLGRIEVGGAGTAARRRFTTALYHSQIEPATFSDVDGRYRGFEDGRVHTANGYTQYADFSGWDVYRSQLPLLSIVQPQVASDVAQSLVADAQQSGWLPKWSEANNHTWIMTGDSAAPAIASVHAFGADDFDTAAALQAMVKGGTQTGQSPNNYVERLALAPYLGLGYVPAERNGNRFSYAFPAFYPPGGIPGAEHFANPWGSAGTTLEYGVDDFAVSQLARALGDTTTCQSFLARSDGWQHLFNPASGFIEPRHTDGTFLAGYDPNAGDNGIGGATHFPEGTAAQWTWMVPHDPAGLAAAMGGAPNAVSRLDAFFTELNAGFNSPMANLGNEVNANAPWLYDWYGQPTKTQAVVRRALTTLYPDSPLGFPGNDDLGQMSAWFVLSSIGLYPAVPGTDLLAIASPSFPKVTLHLGPDHDHVVAIEAPDTVKKPFIRGLQIDGAPHDQPWLRFGDLRGGADLEFTMSASAAQSWGTDPADAPPSFGPTDASACSG